MAKRVRGEGRPGAIFEDAAGATLCFTPPLRTMGREPLPGPRGGWAGARGDFAIAGRRGLAEGFFVLALLSSDQLAGVQAFMLLISRINVSCDMAANAR